MNNIVLRNIIKKELDLQIARSKLVAQNAVADAIALGNYE